MKTEKQYREFVAERVPPRPSEIETFFHAAGGLEAAAGRLFELTRKAWTYNGYHPYGTSWTALAVELGDVLFYATAIMNSTGRDYKRLAKDNMLRRRLREAAEAAEAAEASQQETGGE